VTHQHATHAQIRRAALTSRPVVEAVRANHANDGYRMAFLSKATHPTLSIGCGVLAAFGGAQLAGGKCVSVHNRVRAARDRHVVANLLDVLLGGSMSLVIGMCTGLVCGIAATIANRFWGTVVATAPVAAWIVILIFAMPEGISNNEAGSLGLGMIGIVVGLSLGKLYDFRRNAMPRPTH
jgi:hypothetical protein